MFLSSALTNIFSTAYQEQLATFTWKLRTLNIYLNLRIRFSGTISSTNCTCTMSFLIPHWLCMHVCEL